MNKRNNYKREGYREQYYSNGNLAYKGHFINGKSNGFWEHYYSNGNLFSKGNYLNGKQFGYWEYDNEYRFYTL